MGIQERLLVAIDVGSEKHLVVIARGACLLERFEIVHRRVGFREFFSRVENQRGQGEPVWVILEGSGGWARPLDRQIQRRGYHLMSVNNRKMARFREMFPGPGKTDTLDAERALQVLDWWCREPGAKGICEEVAQIPAENRKLRQLSRHRRALVQDKTRLMSRLKAQLQAALPGLVEITSSLDNLWFLNFLKSRKSLSSLIRMRESSLRRIPGVGVQRARAITSWQRQAVAGDDLDCLGPWISHDVERLLQLRAQLKQLETQIQQLGCVSRLYRLLATIPGFGLVSCAELTGEIGTLKRFSREPSLALYLGSAPLPHCSGKKSATRRPKLVNRRAKNALCQALNRHRQLCPESNAYYRRKKQENGGRHNKAIRALARHMVRVLWSMHRSQRPYEIRQAA